MEEFEPEWQAAARQIAAHYSRERWRNQSLRWYSAITTALLAISLVAHWLR